MPIKGGSFLYELISKDPKNLHGYRVSMWYHPVSFSWTHADLFFSSGYGHWWISSTKRFNQLSIISATPILRLYFNKNSAYTPFFNMGIGLSYLSKTRIDTRNLGIHFAFEDLVGLGIAFGNKKQFAITANALHYSNASLSNMNAGITIPLLVNIDIGFD